MTYVIVVLLLLIISYSLLGRELCGKDFFQKRLNALARLREWFDEYLMMPFEQYMFRVPKHYDEILRHEYGDYMQLPPEEKRIGHHYYKVYKK